MVMDLACVSCISGGDTKVALGLLGAGFSFWVVIPEFLAAGDGGVLEVGVV